MCRVPTTISPIVIRLPRLQFFEGVAAGLRADVNQTAKARGHRMSVWSVGDSHCLDCGMEVSVYRTHSFRKSSVGLAYKGTALDNVCMGTPVPGRTTITRVEPRNRPLKGTRR